MMETTQSIHSKIMAAEQLTFATPDAAVDALVAAVAADDMEKLLDIFGREHESDLIGGDEIASAACRLRDVPLTSQSLDPIDARI